MENPVPKMTAAVGEEAKKIAAQILIYGAIGAAVFFLTPLKDRIQSIWRSPETLEQILLRVEELQSVITRATGEDRVIRMSPGQNYVAEPAIRGQDIILNIVASRTRLGSGCRMTGGVSLFTDESGAKLAGSEVRPLFQIGLEPTRVQIPLTPPERLQVGRVEVYLSLEYNCGGTVVFDRTDTVSFRLQEREDT